MTKSKRPYKTLILLVIVAGVFLAPSVFNKPPTDDISLGEKLFFDRLLSRDNSISCASCHIPDFAFADTAKFSRGVRNQLGTRNTPSSMNMMARPYFFYDGRAPSIQDQVLMPIHNPIEMDLSIPELLVRLNNSHYKQWFNDIYQSDPDSATLSMALAAFVFSLESTGDSPFDRWMRGDSLAMTADQIQGREIFNEKAKCFDCHFGPDFTGDEFRNIGLFNGSDTLGDAGRFVISQDSNDLGKLKVPGLRNISVTAPYMHNGMFQTLEEVIEYYDDPSQFVQHPINIDTLLEEPLQLTEQEKKQLLDFLQALTDAKFQ